MALAARLLPPMARTRRLGLSCLLRSCRFFALGTVETLDQVADRCLLRVHFCRQGRFAFDRPRVLRLPVIGLPRELDIGLLRQHHALLGKRRGVVAVPCREIRGGVALRVGTLHRIRYSRFIWNVLDFLLGAMGWPKLYRDTVGLKKGSRHKRAPLYRVFIMPVYACSPSHSLWPQDGAEAPVLPGTGRPAGRRRRPTGEGDGDGWEPTQSPGNHAQGEEHGAVREGVGKCRG